LHRFEQRSLAARGVPRRLEIRIDACQAMEMRGHVTDLCAFAVDTQKRDAAARVEIFDLEPGELGAAQAVIEQYGQYRAIALALESVWIGRIQKPPRLAITERRRFALVATFLRAMHAVHRIDEDGVFLAQIRKQGGERRQLAPNCRRGKRTRLERIAPLN